MTCWIRALMAPAEDFICSLFCRALLTSSAHSLDRNLTATMPPSAGREPAQYIRSLRRADRRSPPLLPRGARSSLSEPEGGARNMYEFATVALLGLFLAQLVDLVGRIRPISLTARTVLTL